MNTALLFLIEAYSIIGIGFVLVLALTVISVYLKKQYNKDFKVTNINELTTRN
jgi:hypothetical protein